MRTLTILTLLSFLTFGLQAEKYTKPSATSLSFKIKNLGSYVKGTFKTVKVTGVFDSANASNISLKGVAKVSSINTGNNLRNKHLREKTYFFNQKKTPNVIMESYKVQKISKTKYKVFWKITMRGITKKISTTMNVVPSNGGMKLSCAFKIDRNTWKLGGGGLKMATVGDDVIVRISTTLK